jgi:hypothetical protein
LRGSYLITVAGAAVDFHHFPGTLKRLIISFWISVYHSRNGMTIQVKPPSIHNFQKKLLDFFAQLI